MCSENIWRRIDYGNFFPLELEYWKSYIEENFGPIKILHIAPAITPAMESLKNLSLKDKSAAAILNELTFINDFPVSHLWHFAHHKMDAVVTIALKWDDVAVVTQRLGRQKRTAKRYASESLLHMLNQLELLPRNLHEIIPFESEEFSTCTLIDLIIDKPNWHPVSKLYEIQQARKRPPPRFETMQEENGSNWRRKKIVTVTCENCTMTGSGPSLKRAKFMAAHKLVQWIKDKITIILEKTDSRVQREEDVSDTITSSIHLESQTALQTEGI
uniref:DRBM domain-containing protein n=1 Tax=Trichuris muris TaxID=70415 RepID=A0A5S6Q1P7_TRIMR